MKKLGIGRQRMIWLLISSGIQNTDRDLLLADCILVLGNPY